MLTRHAMLALCSRLAGATEPLQSSCRAAHPLWPELGDACERCAHIPGILLICLTPRGGLLLAGGLNHFGVAEGAIPAG